MTDGIQLTPSLARRMYGVPGRRSGRRPRYDKEAIQMQLVHNKEVRAQDSAWNANRSADQLHRLRNEEGKQSARSATDLHNARQAQVAKLSQKYALGGGRSGDSVEYKQQLDFLEKDFFAHENQINELQQQKERFDKVGQAALTKAQKQTESLRSAWGEGKISQMEFLKATQGVRSQVKSFNWKSHLQGPGSKLGDTIEENGILRTRTEKGLEPTGYTADYIEKNTRRIGNTGQYSIPTAPGEKPQIVEAAVFDRKLAEERQGITDAESGIGKIYDGLLKEINASKKMVGDVAQLSEEENDVLLAHAKRQYVRRRKAARAAEQEILGLDAEQGGLIGAPTKSDDPITTGVEDRRERFKARDEEEQQMLRDQVIKSGEMIKAETQEDLEAVSETYSSANWIDAPEAAYNVMNATPIDENTDPGSIQDGAAVRDRNGNIYIKQGETMIPVNADRDALSQLQRRYKIQRSANGEITLEPR